MMSREATIHTAMTISRKYDMSMKDAMVIAIESSMYTDPQASPAMEVTYGSSLSLFDRIVSALKRAIQFIIRCVRELIAKMTNDAGKKAETMNKIATQLKSDIMNSAKKIFTDSTSIMSKCRAYANSITGVTARVASDVENHRDSDLRIPDMKVDPEVISHAAEQIKARADALAEYTTQMHERYAFDDMKVNFNTSVTIFDIMPDSLRDTNRRTLTDINADLDKISKDIDKIYKDCKAGYVEDKDDRGRVENFCGKITRGLNHVRSAMEFINKSLFTRIKIAVPQNP